MVADLWVRGLFFLFNSFFFTFLKLNYNYVMFPFLFSYLQRFYVSNPLHADCFQLHDIFLNTQMQSAQFTYVTCTHNFNF